MRTRAERRIEAARARRRSTPPLATFDGHTYRHTKIAPTFGLPADWKVLDTGPSSDNGEMVTMLSSEPRASISVWMASALGRRTRERRLRFAESRRLYREAEI